MHTDDELETILLALPAEAMFDFTKEMVGQAIDHSADIAKNIAEKFGEERLKQKIKDGSLGKLSKRAWRGIQEDRMWAWLRKEGYAK